MMLRKIPFIRAAYRVHNFMLSSFSTYRKHGVKPNLQSQLSNPNYYKLYQLDAPAPTAVAVSFDNVNSVQEFGKKLQQLRKQFSSRETIHSDERKAIGKLILQYQDQLLPEFQNISYSISLMKFSKADFSNEVNDCLQRVGAIYFTKKPHQVYNYVTWLHGMKFSLQPNQLNDVSKGLTLINNCKSHKLIYSLGHLQVSWSSLSEEATNALQHKLVKDLPEMNEKDCGKMLMGLRYMQATYDQLSIVGSTLLQTIEKYANENKHLYDSLVVWKIPFAVMSENLKQLFIEAFKVKFKSGDTFALYKLSEVIGDSLLPNDLKAFICNELPAVLKSPLAISEISRLYRLSMKWSDIPEDNQDFIINAIVNYLPVMTEKELYFTISGLFHMGVNYNSLPAILQQELLKHLTEIFRNAMEVNHIQNNFHSLFDIGIQASQMNEELRALIRQTIKERLPMRGRHFTSTLNSLSKMGINIDDEK